MEIEEIDLIEKLIGIVRERYVKFSGIVLDLKHLFYYDNWNQVSLIVEYTWVLADWEISYARNRCWDRRLYLDYSNEPRRMCCIH